MRHSRLRGNDDMVACRLVEFRRMKITDDTTLAGRSRAALAEGGALAMQIAGFAPRPSQQDLAAAVADAFEQRDVLLAEAGTGTGKTFAYLVPALLSGLKTIVSTGTRALQDQLYHRDLPRVRDALGTGLKTALLKGRANYLCRYRLERPRASRASQRHVHHARTDRAVPAHRRLERTHAPGRPRRTRSTARGLAAAADGDLDHGELPRQRMPVLGRLLRGAGAAARAERPTSSSSTTTCCSPTWR